MNWLAAHGVLSFRDTNLSRWVEDVAGLPKTTAHYYLRLFVAVEEGRSTLNDITEVGQIAALKAAAELTDETNDEADNEPGQDDASEPPEPSQNECDRIAEAEAGQK